MMYANCHGVRKPATPGQRGECPACGGLVLAKCGELVVWHWAHEAREDCDEWHSGEGGWHRAWKLLVPEEQREVVIGRHRCDIVGWKRTEDEEAIHYSRSIVELQSESLSPEKVREREEAYGRLIWIFKADEFQDRLYFRDGHVPGTVFVGWEHARPSLGAVTQRLILDFVDGGRLLEITKRDEKFKWFLGHWLDRDGFVKAELDWFTEVRDELEKCQK